MKENNLVDCLMKLNENDWTFEKDVKTRNQRKIFKLETNFFWRHKIDLHDLM